LAARCGCSPKFLSNLECARLNLTLASLETLARALGCSESDLLACTPGPAAGTSSKPDTLDP
jgi:transcriptional regulator with XRE-family HTH domain